MPSSNIFVPYEFLRLHGTNPRNRGWFRLRNLVRSAQAIADAGLGQHELRSLRISLDLLPELTHIHPEILRVSELVPQFLQEEAMRQNLAGVLNQHAQQII